MFYLMRKLFQTIFRSTLDKDLLNATFLNIENLRRSKKRSSLSDLMFEVISSIEEPQREKGNQCLIFRKNQ